MSDTSFKCLPTELIEHIGEYLHLSDLCNLRLVGHIFEAATLRDFGIRVFSKISTDQNLKTPNSLYEILSKKTTVASLVKELKLVGPIRNAQTPPTEFVDLVGTLVLLAPRLQILAIEGSGTPARSETFTQFLTPPGLELLPACPRLNHLRLHRLTVDAHDLERLLLAISPKLTALSLDQIHLGEDALAKWRQLFTSIRDGPPGLSHVHISGLEFGSNSFAGKAEWFIKTFKDENSKLQTIQIQQLKAGMRGRLAVGQGLSRLLDNGFTVPTSA